MKAKNSVIYILLSMCLLSITSIKAQGRTRVFFSSGKSLVGELKLHTDEVLILTTEQGNTFQYPAQEIRAVVPDTLHRVRLDNKTLIKAYILKETEDKYIFIDPQGLITQHDKNRVGIKGEVLKHNETTQPVLLHISVQAAAAQLPIQPFWGGAVGANMTVGYRDHIRRMYFAGIGIGYEACINADTQQHFLPLFARLEYYLSPSRSCFPFLGLDAGYAFGLKGVSKGGPLAQLSVGLQKYVGTKHQTFFVALYFKAQQQQGKVQDTIDKQIFYREGTAHLLNAGLRMGFTL